MSYDQNKVDWKPSEHEAAAAADLIFESVREAVSDGIGIDDLTVIGKILKPSVKFWEYLASGSKEEFASKLIDIGVMLKRDNWNALNPAE